MARPPRTTRRQRVTAAVTATVTVAGGAALLAPSTSSASSHREAPYIQGDPAVDNTDTYAFVSPDKPDTVTFVANWAPFSEPAGGPNFFPWDTSAAYDINVDNNGDARPDLVFRYTFKDVDRRGAQERGTVDGTFLYNDGPVTSLTDENLLFRQTYDLTVLRPGLTPRRLLAGAPVAPSNVGEASIPDYAALRQQAVRRALGGQSYVGQADDAFFLDLRIFDLLYGGDLSERGADTLSGYNVNSIALQVPKAELAAGRDVGANPVIGVWSTTSRLQNRQLLGTNAGPATSATDSSDAANQSGSYVQVSRLGNPLVNEAVVPAQLKDFFNRSTPDRDAQFLGKVTDPEIPQLVEGIYGVPNPNRTEAGAGRPDLVAAFLTGISRNNASGAGAGGAAEGSPDVDLNSLDLNAVSPNAAPAEYLRLNMAIAPTASPNRLGVIGGDVAGFPNGRRLGDDVVDIALQVLEGILLTSDPAQQKVIGDTFVDQVDVNDKAFLPTFPYVADPHSGSDPRPGTVR